MELKACNIEEFGKKRAKKADNYKLLTEFADSDMKCARVDGWKHKSAHICATSLRKTIENYNMFDIAVFVRKGEVYLIKTLLVKTIEVM